MQMPPQNDKLDDVQQWLEIRKTAGREIDPDTARLHWAYRYTLDPYGVQKDLPDEGKQISREWFARAPGSDIWVSFHDLPTALIPALRRRAENQPNASVERLMASIARDRS
jgi:hypothetical protein